MYMGWDMEGFSVGGGEVVRIEWGCGEGMYVLQEAESPIKLGSFS